MAERRDLACLGCRAVDRFPPIDDPFLRNAVPDRKFRVPPIFARLIVFPYEDLQLYHINGIELNLGSDDAIETDQLFDRLEQMAVFDLTRDELEVIVTDAALLRFGAGEQIMRAGEENSGLFVVLSGEARKTVPDQQGIEQSLGSALPGDIFGLISVLHRCNSLINVYAHTDLQAARLPFESVAKALRSNSRFGQDLERDIKKRMANIGTLHQRGSGERQGSDEPPGKLIDRVVNLRDLIKRR